MASRSVLRVTMVAVFIAMATAQRENPASTRPDQPSSDRPQHGPCRLTDGADVDLATQDCPKGSTCTVGPVDLDIGGTTTIKAFFCTPRVLPPKHGMCRIENAGVVIGGERTCPDGAACDVGPQEYKDGDVTLSAFYCRPGDPGARLCGVTQDGIVEGLRDCSGGAVCDMDRPVADYDNGYSVYGCRRPKPPTDVCRVEDNAGTIIDEQNCRDDAECDTEGFQFVIGGTTYTAFYCPRNETQNDGHPPRGGPGGKSGESSGSSGDSRGKGRSRPPPGVRSGGKSGDERRRPFPFSGGRPDRRISGGRSGGGRGGGGDRK